MKQKILDWVIFVLYFGSILYIFGIGGSLELDRISIKQTLIQWAAGFAALIIGAVIAGLRQERR